MTSEMIWFNKMIMNLRRRFIDICD